MSAPRTPDLPAHATHPCVRCGAPIPLEDAMCERCNPLGLQQPASSQAHGTVFLGIILAVIGLAFLGRFALSGIGPFTGDVTNVAAQPPSLMVTLTVVNHGSQSGSTTCRVFDQGQQGIGPSDAYVSSPVVPAGQSVSFTREVTTLGGTVRPLAAECTGP